MFVSRFSFRLNVPNRARYVWISTIWGTINIHLSQGLDHPKVDLTADSHFQVARY